MKVKIPGHTYEMSNFENKNTEGQILQFIHKEPAKKLVEEDKIKDSPEFNESTLVTVSDGTTNEEVIEVLIDRLNFLQSKFPCRENAIAITKLEESLMWLNKRTADRLKRNVEGKQIL